MDIGGVVAELNTRVRGLLAAKAAVITECHGMLIYMYSDIN